MDKNNFSLYNVKCSKKEVCLLGQVVKTSPSHGGVRGSTPLGDTKRNRSAIALLFRCIALRGVGPERGTAVAKRSGGSLSRPWSEPTERGGERRRICVQRRKLP